MYALENSFEYFSFLQRIFLIYFCARKFFCIIFYTTVFFWIFFFSRNFSIFLFWTKCWNIFLEPSIFNVRTRTSAAKSNYERCLDERGRYRCAFCACVRPVSLSTGRVIAVISWRRDWPVCLRGHRTCPAVRQDYSAASII